MKRILALILCLSMALGLCACGSAARLPAADSAGNEWDTKWTSLGGTIGVEQPENGFVCISTNGSTKDMDMYFATWVAGEETDLGDDTYAYDAQIYLITEDCNTSADAEDTKSLWREQIGGDFVVTEERSFTAGGVEFTLVFYDCAAEDSHFSHGVTALGVWKDIVIVADIGCVDGMDLDLTATVEDFLSGFHYA